MEKYDCIIIGTGPAGLGAAFSLISRYPEIEILIIDKDNICSGGLRNDCKMNFTYPVGFPLEHWTADRAEYYLSLIKEILKPKIMEKKNLEKYKKRSIKLGVKLLDIEQAHLGTDGGILLVKELFLKLKSKGVNFLFKEEMKDILSNKKSIITDQQELGYKNLIIAPGRKGFIFLKHIMDKLKIHYIDHIIDIGIRLETKEEYYPIVYDYYDPKFLFPDKVRTFCTNSRAAYVVKEVYSTHTGQKYYSINGYSFSEKRKKNNFVNFALLKTVMFTEPLASGQQFAEMLGLQAMLMGGGKPIIQRVGDFRLGKRSTKNTFNDDLYDFEPTLKNCTPGDISLSMPAKILRAIWKSMKYLDTIIPGILHPSTIMYYPEIKLYANKPKFIDDYFKVKDNIYLIGDGAGVSRGITSAWASGMRAAEGILKS